MYSMQPTLFKYVARLALTCKQIYIIAQKIIDDGEFIYHIYQKSIDQPDIVDNQGEIYIPKPIGNNIWFLSIKQSSNAFMFVEKEWFEYYHRSDRYFRENETYLVGKQNSIVTAAINRVHSICFTIHYKANFGEILLLTWYEIRSPYNTVHHHIKMAWTGGDVWVGVIDTTCSDIGYRYEVCIDNGGPIIRKETKYRNMKPSKAHVVSDVWDNSQQVFIK
jgi:hypothetical protein